MTTRLRSRIRESLANANLQSALSANAERRIRVRTAAFGTLPDPEGSRQKAHLVRADVIEHLDSYLALFVERATQNGIQVHRATDAKQAVQTVLNIANQHGARLIAKAKTMVSEEISLNHSLEDEGFQVVETDLGEYIVQLRGEKPAHIITPAVHLRRQDVGKLFEQKLGIPYTEDISVMTTVARKTLRQVFLDADVGISGVNFGVAETGTLCIVTNEGNGRMVTTLPRAHIALMGIERLVPTMDDLALMLSLLPRSATGQKLSVYTSLLNSPRRPGDPDGPLERHVILVDNGRSAVRGSDLEEILYCIRCGACLNACPVFRQMGGHAYIGKDGEGSPYPGPMGSIVSPALFGLSEFGQLARASSLCGACREVCPVDINLPKLLLRVRSGMGPTRGDEKNIPNAPGWLAAGVGVFSFAATSAWRFNLAQKLAGFFGSLAAIFRRNDPWIHMPAISGWGYSKDFPRPSSRPFHTRYKTQIKDAGNANQAVDRKGYPGDTPHLDKAAQIDTEVLVDKFTAELETLGAKVHACTLGEEADVVLKILENLGIDEILAWEPSQLTNGILEKLSRAGIRITHPDANSIPASSQVKAGLSGATAGIADTGSLLVIGGPGMPLNVSLLPEVHIAIVQERDIVKHLPEAFNLESLQRSPAAALITGPSRTSDIEMTLTIGVHGPGVLHVICIKDV